MDQKQLALEHRLLQLRDEMKALKDSTLPYSELKEKLTLLRAERNRLEQELLDLVMAPGNTYRAGALDGLREGLHSAMVALEEKLRIEHPDTNGATPPAPKPEGRLTQLFKRLAERPILSWVAIFSFVYLLLIAVAALGEGFEAFFGGQARVEQLFSFAKNPFLGLLMGLLATAIIQSSSVTTSVIVSLCAGGLPVEQAIPMVMGANIGTSVTNTLVSLGHIGHRREFRRAFAAATIHDFFNLTAVAIFLPLEMCFGLLAKVSGTLSGTLYGGMGSFNFEDYNFLAMATQPVENALHELFRLLPLGAKGAEGLYIIFGLGLIFLSILLLGLLLRLLLTGRAEKVFRNTVNCGGVKAIGSGFAITALVQSSSTTTSLIVPLAGAGLMKLKQAYPFTLGANIGTCVTALMAAMAITGAGAQMGLQIALVHFLFNTLGVTLIYGFPPLRRVPLICASSLAKLAANRRPLAILYIVVVFFIVPLLGLGVYKLFA